MAQTVPPGRRSLTEVLLGSRNSIAGTVYGSVIVMATIAAGSKGGLTAWQLLATVWITVIVLWVAHVYADGLAASIQADRRLTWTELLHVAHHELAIPLAAIGPGLALLLGVLDAVEGSTAAWAAMVTALAVLGVQGLRYARAERLSGLATVVSVAINLSLGLAIVALKAVLTH